MKEQSMGRILRRIRIEQGMTQEALVEGICTAGYLSRVENGSQIPSRQIYQLLMERLGESGYSYAYWQEEEEKEQTCRELLHALQTWQKEHVDEKLLKLQKMKGAQDIRERQFYGMAHVIWLYMNEAIPQEDYLGCCRTIWESDAQGKTRRRQGMDKIEFAEMSEVQLWILNNLAIGHMWRGEYRKVHPSYCVFAAMGRSLQRMCACPGVCGQRSAIIWRSVCWRWKSPRRLCIFATRRLPSCKRKVDFLPYYMCSACRWKPTGCCRIWMLIIGRRPCCIT